MTETLFISDLHLQESEPQILQIFLKLLQSATSADALYILGDLFEVWIGDDDLSPFHLKIINALKQATSNGLPVYFMRGNRDFLIGKRFAAMTGVKLLQDPATINLYGIKTLLMHGDSLCTLDLAHQKNRTYMHNRFYQWLALRLPLSWRKKAGVWLRAQSRKVVNSQAQYIMDVTDEAVEAEMHKHQATRLIHGHTHRPNIHEHSQGLRYVLGSWHNGGYVLVCHSAGDITIREYENAD
ncbi:MAG: UDP-2,3-diacylglucosamine diphosphatase [Proteobacteria bacterium]|nr:UDP-2,3-diacylglucosamine diphosphatase [Pseudomonadota bacterium]